MAEDRQYPLRRGLSIHDGVLYGADAAVGKWVAARVPGYALSAASTALGVVRGGKMVAGVIYERFNGVHCEATIAAATGSSWASRRVLHRIFAYPFLQLGCEAISVCVAMTNLPSMNLATKLGFAPEALVTFAAHDGSTLVILKAHRETCRWIRGETDGQG